MHSYISIFLLIAISCSQICCEQIDRGWLSSYLQELGFFLKNGYKPLGLPKADPLNLKVSFNIDNEIIKGRITLNGQLSDFSNFFVSNLTLTPNLFLDLDTIFYSVTFQGDYEIDATVYKDVVPLCGSGPLNVYFSFVELASNGTLVAQYEMLQLKDFNFQLKHMNAIQVTAEGLLKDYGLDGVLELVLQNSLDTVIKLFTPEIEGFINEFVMNIGNHALRGITISRLLEIIKELTGAGKTPTIAIPSNGVVNRQEAINLVAQKMWNALSNNEH